MKNEHESSDTIKYLSRQSNWEARLQESEVEIMSMDMDKETCEKVLRITLRTLVAQKEALVNSSEETENKAFMTIAKAIKSNLAIAARKENPWQVIIGRSYGTFVTHESKYFLFFKYAGLWFTLFVSN
jgi:hypothetical protein